MQCVAVRCSVLHCNPCSFSPDLFLFSCCSLLSLFSFPLFLTILRSPAPSSCTRSCPSPHLLLKNAHCNTLQHAATRFNTLQHAATRCNTLQHATTHCNTLHTLQHTATHCNTLQHTAPQHILFSHFPCDGYHMSSLCGDT